MTNEEQLKIRGVQIGDANTQIIFNYILGAGLQKRQGILNTIPHTGEPELEQLHQMLQAQGTVVIAVIQGLGESARRSWRSAMPPNTSMTIPAGSVGVSVAEKKLGTRSCSLPSGWD